MLIDIVCLLNPNFKCYSVVFQNSQKLSKSTELSTKCKKKEQNQYIRVSHWSPVHPSSQPSVQILTKLQLLLAQLFGQYSLQEGPRQSTKEVIMIKRVHGLAISCNKTFHFSIGKGFYKTG
jgi:hypothetical protein